MPHWLYLLPIIFINVTASLLLKSGANAERLPLFFNFISFKSFLGLMCFGFGGLAYAWILRFVPLNIAQAVLSSQYIFTLLGAYFILNESFDRIQGIGFVIIAFGIALVVSR